jgi:hypothetical protein
MTATIRFKAGSYRNRDVSGMVFALVEQFKTTGKSSFVTVRNDGKFPGFPDSIRVNVTSQADYEFVSGEALPELPRTAAPVAMLVTETDEEVMARIGERFDILTDMTRAAINGDIRAMIVSGPPGVGKSYGVEQEIERASLLDKLSNRRIRHEVIKGSTSAIGLYCTLYKYSDPGCVLVFDDCDSVLMDDTSLNLLKGALDSGKSRKISWLAESHALRREGVPDSFNFKGSVIFLSNIKFDQVKSSKLKEHLEALQSRCHYLDLTLNTMRDKILRIKQVAMTSNLFDSYDFEPNTESEIINFMDANQTKLREVTLRMAIKIADLVKSFPDKWQRLAQTTCMRAE